MTSPKIISRRSPGGQKTSPACVRVSVADRRRQDTAGTMTNRVYRCDTRSLQQERVGGRRREAPGVPDTARSARACALLQPAAWGVRNQRLCRRDRAGSEGTHDGGIAAGESGGSEPPRRLMRAAVRTLLREVVSSTLLIGGIGGACSSVRTSADTGASASSRGGGMLPLRSCRRRCVGQCAGFDAGTEALMRGAKRARAFGVVGRSVCAR